MKKHLIFFLAFLLSLPLAAFSALPQSQTLKEQRSKLKADQPPKLAPDLEEILALDDQQALTLGQMRHNRLALKPRSNAQPTRINGVTLPSEEVPADEKQSFIVQLDRTTPEIVLQEKLALLGGRISRKLDQMGLAVIEAPRAAIRQIAADSNITYVSPDRLVASSGHIGNTTGWKNTGISDKGDTDPNTWLIGGVGHVAVIDSGLYTNHSLLRWMDAGGTSKVKYNKDFTGQNITGDPYGHGTHVASLLAGDWVLGGSAYEAVGDGNSLLNLRALDSNGVGTASNVIAAIDWCVTNKTAWNIRVINLSLGTIAKDSYVNDPLCQAARRAWNAGMVVVCAAGNDGKAANGSKVYGAIHSPGNDPSVITVGAVNTFGTDSRADDVVASYSSRGPTRSYVTVNGVRKYDNLIKPDLVAPGNKLIGARSTENNNSNTLATNYPTLQTGASTVATDKLMYLSGTSMATPIVAAAASLLIQTNPNLTPNLIKAILMYSAQPLANANTFEQGAGLLNIDGAVRLARLVKPTMPTTNGTALLTAALPTSQTSVIAGQTIKWGQGVITDWGFLYGSGLMQYWQSVYASGSVLADATAITNGVFGFVAGKTSGASLKSGSVRIGSSGSVLADGTVLADGSVLADGIILGDGSVLADGIILGDGSVLADGRTRADTTLRSASSTAYLGDSTAAMQPAP